MERGHTVKVLDHGFLKLVDNMGTDESIIEAARMSTGRGFVSWDPYRRCKRCDLVGGQGNAEPLFCPAQRNVDGVRVGPPDPHDWQDFPRGDVALLERLWSSGHATPFEMCQLVVEVQAPIMVFREWHRHRTQGFSEFSARYAQMPDLHYLPADERIQKQSATNKQGAGEVVDAKFADQVRMTLMEEQETGYAYYDFLCREGVAREVARINTPISRYSKMRATANLRNWLGFLKLRLDKSAQFEIRMFAEALAEIVRALWPRTWALFEEHTLHAVTLSRTEREALANILDHEGTFPGIKGNDIYKKLRGS